MHSCGIRLWSEHHCTSFLLQVAATLLHLSHRGLTKANVLQNCSCSLQHRQGQSGAGWGTEGSSEGGLEKAEKEQSKESEDRKEISSDYRSCGMEVGPDPGSQQCHLMTETSSLLSCRTRHSIRSVPTSLLSVWVSWLSPNHSALWGCVHVHVEAMRRQQCCSACRKCNVLQDQVGSFPLSAPGSSVKLPWKTSACCGGLQDLPVQLAPGCGWVSACVPRSMLGYNVYCYVRYFNSYLRCLLWRQAISAACLNVVRLASGNQKAKQKGTVICQGWKENRSLTWGTEIKTELTAPSSGSITSQGGSKMQSFNLTNVPLLENLVPKGSFEVMLIAPLVLV